VNTDPHRRGGDARSERFWEGHYRQRDQTRRGNANPVLVHIAGSLAPGRALDLGCGEGADAIWLAESGWRVTAVDVSATALERAAAHAAAAGVENRIDFQRHDLSQSFPEGTFDLVSAQYLQSSVEFARDRVLRRAAAAVAANGLLLIVTHASIAPWSWKQGPDTRFPTPEEELGALGLDAAQWHREVVSDPERQATGPNGQVATVRDNVIAIRRLVS